MEAESRKHAMTPVPFALSIVAWCALGGVWYLLTKRAHPDDTIAALVTAALVGSYAIASYVHHLLLRPRLCAWRYWLMLTLLACASGGLGLFGARTVYASRGYTPGSPLYHFAIDTLGAIIHLALAAGVVWIWRRATRQQSEP